MHCENCELRKYRCKAEGCDKEFLKDDLILHESECELIVIQCKLC